MFVGPAVNNNCHNNNNTTLNNGILQELLESGYLTEVHKFSKFIHGTCTLFPELVQAVPYWVDDESVRPSMLSSAPPPPRIEAPAAAGSSAAATNGAHTSIEVQEDVSASRSG